VGNTWLKWSYQFVYWYLGIIIHCADWVEGLIYLLIALIKLYIKQIKKHFKKLFE
jgi:hypothetical protein